METNKDLITVGDLDGHQLQLHWMSGNEDLGGRLAGMFEYHLEVASKEADLKPKDVLGKKLSVKILLPDDDQRYFNGHVTAWSFHGLRNERAIYHLTLRPWLWLLNFTSDCRIFNKKSPLDIVKSIFKKYSEAEFDEGGILASDYPPYEYVVQYRESDYNLVCRLLQQEGIYFFFTHDAHKHTLTLADGPSAHSSPPGYETIPYMPPTTTAKEMAPHFDRCTFGQGILVKSYWHTDYDFKNAKKGAAQMDLLTSGRTLESESLYRIGESFDYPGRYLERSKGEALAGVRLDEAYAPSQLIEVDGNPLGLGIGDLFTLSNPPGGGQATKYVVVSAHYELHVPDEQSTAGGPFERPYRAHYTLIPAAAQYRPPRTASKPIVHGPQTAVVVGKKKTADPDPEEIEVDPYGRVRVRFHWERIGDQHPDSRGKKAAGGAEDDFAQEEGDTCYIRVAQMWAGSRWGSIYIPRIGQEVVVEFLEGDPDRPLITGCVYNNVNKPPYDLPQHMTQSGIKSRSTKGGTQNNFNELRFEDLKGQEEVHMQAEKDLSILVKNDESRSVGHDRAKSVGNNETVKVGVNRTESVGADEKIDIGANRTETVAANESITIGGNRTKSVGANETVTIAAASTETIGATRAVTIAAAYQLTVGGAINETVGAAKAEEIGGAKSVNVGAASSESVAGKKTLSAGGAISASSGSKIEIVAKSDIAQKAGANFVVEAADQVAIKCGSATLVLKKSGEITINGQKITVKASGDVVVKGSNINEN